MKWNALHRQLPRLVAFVAIAATYSLARLPHLAAAERLDLSASFAFERYALPSLGHLPRESVRAVHPDLERISAWISSVGAAVALADLDGDGLPNDVCLVDTGIDQVVITSTPGSGMRYTPFALDPTALPYDELTMAPMGCIPGDLNEDGRNDLLVYYWGRTPIAFMGRPSTGDTPLGSQAYRPVELVPGRQRWFTNAATRADVDGDGQLDIIIGNYFPDGAHILNPHDDSPQQMQDSMSRALNGGTNRILLWQGATAGADPSVTFVEAPGVFTPEVAHGWTLALGAADLDGDGRPELYFANDFGPDRLLHNRSQPGRPAFTVLTGQRLFTTPKSKVLGEDSFKGMGVDFADVNGDGWLDIYVSNIAAEYALEESHFLFLSTGDVAAMQEGLAPYQDASEQLGVARSNWGWEARLADFNNDGRLEAIQATGFVRGEANRWPELHELAMGNDTLLRYPALWPRFAPGDGLSGRAYTPFFVQAPDGRYYDIAAEVGLDDPQISRGIAVADADGNGTLDFAVGNQWQSSYYYQNRCPDCAAFVGLRLWRTTAETGVTVLPGRPPLTSGAAAVGAEAIITLPDGRRLVGQVDGGNGHSGVRSPELHWGLGDWPADAPLSISLRWRDAAGVLHTATLSLTPGWHTVILGNNG